MFLWESQNFTLGMVSSEIVSFASSRKLPSKEYSFPFEGLGVMWKYQI